MPAQSVPKPTAGAPAIPPELFEPLWEQSGAEAYGLSRPEALAILAAILANAGAEAASDPESFFRALRLPDLLLARACAAGHERAWQHFIALYQDQLNRAAIAITGNDTVGRDLAGSLYAELYGLSERDGQRRCPLDSYRGRGSLIGWLRTTLAQRHVDHFRRHHREDSLERPDGSSIDLPAPAAAPLAPARDLVLLSKALRQALAAEPAEDRFLVAAYYIDGRKLHEIGRLLDVHEATISRKLGRAVGALHKQLLKNLCDLGLSRSAAEEALGADPRDLEIDLKKLLQTSPTGSFPVEAPL